MSAPAVVAGRPSVRIRGTQYPVLLPTVRDPRLHLAAVIVSLQVLGQMAFGFQLSIAQILVSLVTCAVLEVAIAFRRQRVLMWPASALLTGNGVAFVLRVPGTEHGDWWSMDGWWIFAGTAAVALLSKYLIVFRGRHVFNPSNFGLVLCFLLLGSGARRPARSLVGADVGLDGAGAGDHRRRRARHPHPAPPARDRGLLLGRVRRGHRGARSQRPRDDRALAPGPVTGWEFWRVLVFSPEILVFLFFMITDPKTIPAGGSGAALLRRRDRAPRHAPDRAADDRVRDEGRRPGGARARLRGAARSVEVVGSRSRRRPGRPGGHAAEPWLWRARRRSRALVVLAGIPARTGRRPRARRRSRPASSRRSPSSPRRTSRPRSTGRRRSGSPATSSRTFGSRARRWPSATTSGRPRAPRAPGSPPSGSRSTRRGGRWSSPTTTSSACELTLRARRRAVAAARGRRRSRGRSSSPPTRARRPRSRSGATRRRSSRPRAGAPGRPLP